jgi:hypothetical protein
MCLYFAKCCILQEFRQSVILLNVICLILCRLGVIRTSVIVTNLAAPGKDLVTYQR